MGNPENRRTSNYVKYTGVAFQMLVIIGVFAFIGYKIDEYKGIENSLFTAIFGIIGVAASLYQVIRSLSKEKGDG